MLGISPLSPSLVEGFGLTRLQVALMVPSIYLGGLLFSLPGGRLADRVGVRPSLLGGLLVGAGGLAAGALSPGFALFLFCLFVAGTGWSVVNPALGKAIMDLFPAPERGMAMGIKQMGLTLGGIAAALVLPRVAEALGWRIAIATCALVVTVAVALIWRPLGRLDGRAPAAAEASALTAGDLSWARRPAILMFFTSGLIFGMVQAAVLSYLPLYTIQALGYDAVGAGLLVACSQAGGAVSRLVLGAASDRWFADRRSVWLALTGRIGVVIFAAYALLAGVGTRRRRNVGLPDRRRRLRLGGRLFRHERGAGRGHAGRLAERDGVCFHRGRAAHRPGRIRAASRPVGLVHGALGGLRFARGAGHRCHALCRPRGTTLLTTGGNEP
jgi:predicted MFS family arabinose efflux permease